jgi:opacity protein-like surface antigen
VQIEPLHPIARIATLPSRDAVLLLGLGGYGPRTSKNRQRILSTVTQTSQAVAPFAPSIQRKRVDSKSIRLWGAIMKKLVKKLLLLVAGIATLALSGTPADAQFALWASIAYSPGWGLSDQTDFLNQIISSLPNDDGHYRMTGTSVGGTLGYNVQNGPWVYGIETDYSWSDIKGSSDACGSAPGNPGHPCGTKLESLGTVRARLGIAIDETSRPARKRTKAAPIASRGPVIYITGGFAYGDVHGWDALTPASGSKICTGWTAGGGVEWALLGNWSAKIEYLYVDLGKQQLFDVVPGVPETVSLTSNIVRVGLGYTFGGNAAPLVTKY